MFSSLRLGEVCPIQYTQHIRLFVFHISSHFFYVKVLFRCIPRIAASFPDVSLAEKGVGAQGRKGRGKDASRARPQFLVLLARSLHLLLNRSA